MRFLGISPQRATALGVAIMCATAFTFATSSVVHAEEDSAGGELIVLGEAEHFAVLAGSGITNTGTTTVSGTGGTDVGSSPTPTLADNGNFSTDGVVYTELDPAVTAAKEDLELAFADAINQSATHTGVMVLDGHTLTPGVYHSGSSMDLSVGETLTLDAEGDEDAVFIFQALSTLTTVTGSSMELINGAQASNVFWYVGSSATLGTYSHFEGTIMARASITAATGATINGRLLALDAAVTLDTNTIVNNEFVATVAPEPEPEPEPEPGPDNPGEPDPDTPGPGTPESDTPESDTPGADDPGEYPARTRTEVGGAIPDTGTNDWFLAALAGLGVAIAGVLGWPRVRRHG